MPQGENKWLMGLCLDSVISVWLCTYMKMIELSNKGKDEISNTR